MRNSRCIQIRFSPGTTRRMPIVPHVPYLLALYFDQLLGAYVDVGPYLGFPPEYHTGLYAMACGRCNLAPVIGIHFRHCIPDPLLKTRAPFRSFPGLGFWIEHLFGLVEFGIMNSIILRQMIVHSILSNFRN